MQIRRRAKFVKVCRGIFVGARDTQRFLSRWWRLAACGGYANEVLRSAIPDGGAEQSSGCAGTHGARAGRVESVRRRNRLDGADGSGEIAAAAIFEHLEIAGIARY